LIYDATYFHAAGAKPERARLLPGLVPLHVRYHLSLDRWNVNVEAALQESLGRVRADPGELVLDMHDLDGLKKLNPRYTGLDAVVETSRGVIAHQRRVTGFLGGVMPEYYLGITGGWFRTMWLEPEAYRLALRPLTYDVASGSRVGLFEHLRTLHLPFRPHDWTAESARWDHAIDAATRTVAELVHDHSKLGVLWTYPEEFDTAAGLARQLDRIADLDLSAAIWVGRDVELADAMRAVIEERA
jgi:hypothetical protein